MSFTFPALYSLFLAYLRIRTNFDIFTREAIMEFGESYSRLPSEPPVYEELNLNELARSGPDREFLEFEIEDENIGDALPTNGRGFFGKASFMTRKFAQNFDNLVMSPMSQLIDPVHRGFSFLNEQYEKTILRVGNPLVVKRLLYLFFIIILILGISRFDLKERISGPSGGDFSSQRLYDVERLSETINKLADPNLLKQHLEYFSRVSHTPGTKGGLVLSKYISDYMKYNGVNVRELEEIETFINYPSYDENKTYVKLADDSFSARLFEMDKQDMQYLSFNPNGMGTGDEIEAQFVFANFGSSQDLDRISDSGIDLKDKVVLLKYGGALPESIKIKNCEQRGLKGVIFITPPYMIGPPDSQLYHDDLIQRKNVGAYRISPGDMLRPGWSSSDKYEVRFDWSQSPTTPKIPSIPISHRDAQEFLSRIDQGGAIFEDGMYSGRPNERSKLKFRITNIERPKRGIWNILGSIQGREEVEKGVIIGANRDSTCYGTIASGTGTAILLELIKVFASLQRQFNWSPERSIYFASFDGSDYNLAGLTEWIEKTKSTLQKEGFAYIDLSDAVAGEKLLITAHPFFQTVIRECLSKIDATNGGFAKTPESSLYTLFKNQNSGEEDFSNNFLEQKNYLPFINLLNIPSIELKFSGHSYPEGSCYDNFEIFEASKIDSNMHKHRLLVQFLTFFVLNMVEKSVIPYNMANFATKLSVYRADLEKFAKGTIPEYGLSRGKILNFGELDKAVALMKQASSALDEWYRKWKSFVQETGGIEPAFLSMVRWKWNANMITFNEQFVLNADSRERPGYANRLFGLPLLADSANPSEYEWNTFPFVRDYIQFNDLENAQKELDEIAKQLTTAAKQFSSL